MRMNWALMLTLPILAAACGGGASDAAPAGGTGGAETAATAMDDLDGCSIVTAEEVSAALGGPVGDGEDRGLVGCGWRTESGATVVLQVFAGSMLASGTCDGQKFLVSGREEEIPDLGDSALWGTSGDLVVCDSRAVLKIDIDNTPNSPEEDRDAAVRVARAALARLGA